MTAPAHIPTRARLLGAALAVTAALALPAAASASTASVANGVLTYNAAPGESNNVSLTFSFGYYYLQDAGATIRASGGCTTTNYGHTAACPFGTLNSVAVDLGDGNDSFTSFMLLTPVTVHGGTGNDTLKGGTPNDTLYGDDGNDTLDGGSGDDTLDGGLGADSISGGAGDDTVTYASRTAPVSVSLDGAAGDGEAGEGDNVANSVENVVGGSGDDTIAGSAAANTIDGGPGSDTIDAGAGTDTILAHDGATDTITCGADADTVANDPFDNVASDCEARDALLDPAATAITPGGLPVAPAGGDSAPTPAVNLAPLVPTVPVQHPVASAAGVVPLRLSCPRAAGAGCAGTVSLTMRSPAPGKNKVSIARRRKVLKVGGKRFRLAAGATKAVPVALARRGVRQLHRGRKLALKVTVTISADGGKTASSSRTVVVHERRTASRRVTRKRKR